MRKEKFQKERGTGNLLHKAIAKICLNFKVVQTFSSKKLDGPN